MKLTTKISPLLKILLCCNSEPFSVIMWLSLRLSFHCVCLFLCFSVCQPKHHSGLHSAKDKIGFLFIDKDVRESVGDLGRKELERKAERER